jgi:hypothetical protein
MQQPAADCERKEGSGGDENEANSRFQTQSPICADLKRISLIGIALYPARFVSFVSPLTSGNHPITDSLDKNPIKAYSAIWRKKIPSHYEDLHDFCLM